MPKRQKPSKTPARFTKAHTPAINLTDEIKVVTELLAKQRSTENDKFEYALITTTKSVDIKNVDDEFVREKRFVEQAQQAASQAIANCKELGIPTEIPPTYKGELVKNEKQMAKVRDHLKDKKDSMEKSEKMKKLRELKKMGKKIQEEVLRKRNKDKKEFLEKVKKKPVSELFDD